MRIAVDLDDVILDFVGNLCTVINTEYDAGLNPEDIVEWDLRKVLDEYVGENWWRWWKERDWLWALAPAVPGAIGGLRTLRKEGHDVEIVTSKPEWAEAQTFRWLGKWRPPVKRVTIVGMDEKKAEVSDAELLIDDKPLNIEEWVAHPSFSREKFTRKAWLFARPHNAAFRKDLVVVDGWREVIEKVRAFEAVRGEVAGAAAD